MIKVSVAGACGKMGQEVCKAVEAAADMQLVGRADPQLGTSLSDFLADSDVVVDFTRPDTALANAKLCAEAGVHVVIGTTGFEVDKLSGLSGSNIFFAPNFAIGAVLMMKFAQEAAKHIDKVEIIELHHDQKLDRPSGTAARTAEMIGREVPIHSVRLPGFIAHQEVIFGELGQTLTLRHDTTSRESFMPGVLLAVRKVASLSRSPVVGLENFL